MTASLRGSVTAWRTIQPRLGRADTRIDLKVAAQTRADGRSAYGIRLPCPSGRRTHSHHILSAFSRDRGISDIGRQQGSAPQIKVIPEIASHEH